MVNARVFGADFDAVVGVGAVVLFLEVGGAQRATPPLAVVPRFRGCEPVPFEKDLRERLRESFFLRRICFSDFGYELRLGWGRPLVTL